MKKVLIILIFFITADNAYSFDINGIQPVSPCGIFSTFSTDSIPATKYAVQFTFERSTEPDYYRMQMNSAYGLTNNIDIYLSIPYVLSFMNSVDGMEDIAIGIKHRFYNGDRYGPSLAYMAGVSLPTGRKELSSEGKIGAGIILSKRIGPFHGNINIFYEKPGQGNLQDELRLASGIELAATHNSFILAELIAKRGYYSGEYNQAEAKIGYRLRTTENIYTTFGIGTDLRNRSPEYRLFFSISFSNAVARKKLQMIFESE